MRKRRIGTQRTTSGKLSKRLTQQLLAEVPAWLHEIRLQELRQKARSLNCTLDPLGPEEYRLLDQTGEAICLMTYRPGPEPDPMGGRTFVTSVEDAGILCGLPNYDPSFNLDQIDAMLRGIELRLPWHSDECQAQIEALLDEENPPID